MDIASLANLPHEMAEHHADPNPTPRPGVHG